MVDDLATTRKAGAKYFHELFQREDCVLAGPVKSQLQNFFGKRPPCSRADLHSDTLAELMKWEILAPVEGTMEYDKARVRNVRDYLSDQRFEVEMKRGLVVDDHDLGRARHLQQSELEHEGAEKSQKLRRAHKLYKRRTVAPLYNHDGKVISNAEKDKIEQKEIDWLWGYDDASEEEAGYVSQRDVTAVSGMEGGDVEEDLEDGGVALKDERSRAEDAPGPTMTFPFRGHE